MMRWLVLELRRDQGLAICAANDKVGAARPPGSWKQWVVVEYLVGQMVLADHLAQPGLHSPDQVSRPLTARMTAASTSSR